MTAPSPSLKELFLAALDVAPEGRAAWLERECAADAGLREHLRLMLAAHDAPQSLLDRPAAPLAASLPHEGVGPTVDQPPAEAPGTSIGPYKLLEQIGEGGMGTVWMAQQTEPVKRLVAVKVIKPGMDSKQVVARFEAERQALALMDHPNIARVLDGGATGAGRPYFVMDLVKGVAITRYCDAHRLTPRQRLELFVPVCQAVQHAHQKGIIHRDVKPSNVLVALYDGKPVPKVIDFGVAKAAGQTLTDKTLVTGFGAIVGTLEYMSPEQAEVNQLDIDTRSDIYALGVLLYELLAGSPPFTRKESDKGGLLEMLRVIREQEPTKPSAKLSTADGLPTLAANRGTEPAKLTRLVRGELDWIVMKALEKDRARRYDTANGFALDVQRYLADEPVLACPPSAGYRLRKFARKHRGPLWAAATIAVLLVIGIVVSTWQAVRATAAERAEAERLGQVQKSKDILAGIFADLDIRRIQQETEPLEAVLAQRLVNAAAQLEGEAVGDPLLVADLQNRLGRTLLNLGYPQEAIGLCAKARDTRHAQLGADHPDTLDSMNNLGAAYQAVGNLDLALPLYEETLKLRQARLGPDHPATLASMNNLASAYQAAGNLDLALPLYEETLKLMKAKRGPDHPDTLASMNNLASAYQAAGNLGLALPLFEETLKLRQAKLVANHPDTLTSMNSLAWGYYAAGNLDLALPLYEETLKLRQARLGANHPDTLTSMNNLALCYQAVGKLGLALPLYEETLKLRKAKLGADHPATLMSMNNLALCYQAAGKLGLALPLYEETLKLRQAKLVAGHPDTLVSMHSLASGYQAAGRLDLALPLYEETLKLMKAKRGPDHPDTLAGMNSLAAAYQAANQLALALPLFEEALKLTKAKLGPGHPDTLTSMNNLGAAYQAAGHLDLALPLLEEALKLRQAKLVAGHPDTLSSMNNLAAAYRAAGKPDLALPLLEGAAAGMEKRRFQHEYAAVIVNNLINCQEQLKQFDQAEAWQRKWLAVVRERSGADSVPAAGVLAAIGSNLLQQKKWADAEAVLRECLAIREKKQPDAWTTFNAWSLLGAAHLGQQHYAEAEPLLLAGYQGMRRREATIPNEGKIRLPEAAARLVQLYEAWGKEAEAGRWRKELEAGKAATQDQKPKEK
jgi:serine/threonine protein kinase